MRLTFHAEDRSVRALDGFSLELHAGEFLCLVGPSGCGKSTVLNLIAGLLEPDTGEILADGEISRERAGDYGYMPQKDLLLPWRVVLDNAILAPEIAGRSETAARARALELMPRFGLAGFESAYPSTLSGGMRQRAALLRTFLSDRVVLLLDEPFGALDALTRRDLQDWLLDLWSDSELSVLFVTHDIEEALYLGDRVAVMSPRPGAVVQTLDVVLPRPRQQSMTTLPEFRKQLAALLAALETSN